MYVLDDNAMIVLLNWKVCQLTRCNYDNVTVLAGMSFRVDSSTIMSLYWQVCLLEPANVAVSAGGRLV